MLYWPSVTKFKGEIFSFVCFLPFRKPNSSFPTLNCKMIIYCENFICTVSNIRIYSTSSFSSFWHQLINRSSIEIDRILFSSHKTICTKEACQLKLSIQCCCNSFPVFPLYLLLDFRGHVICVTLPFSNAAILCGF